jgi:hypothetical protein
LSLCRLFRTPRDDGLQGNVNLARGLAEVGVEGVIVDRQGEAIRAGVFDLFLPDAQLTAPSLGVGWIRCVGAMGLLLETGSTVMSRSKVRVEIEPIPFAVSM